MPSHPFKAQRAPRAQAVEQESAAARSLVASPLCARARVHVAARSRICGLHLQCSSILPSSPFATRTCSLHAVRGAKPQGMLSAESSWERASRCAAASARAAAAHAQRLRVLHVYLHRFSVRAAMHMWAARAADRCAWEQRVARVSARAARMGGAWRQWRLRFARHRRARVAFAFAARSASRRRVCT